MGALWRRHFVVLVLSLLFISALASGHSLAQEATPSPSASPSPSESASPESSPSNSDTSPEPTPMQSPPSETEAPADGAVTTDESDLPAGVDSTATDIPDPCFILTGKDCQTLIDEIISLLEIPNPCDPRDTGQTCEDFINDVLALIEPPVDCDPNNTGQTCDEFLMGIIQQLINDPLDPPVKLFCDPSLFAENACVPPPPPLELSKAPALDVTLFEPPTFPDTDPNSVLEELFLAGGSTPVGPDLLIDLIWGLTPPINTSASVTASGGSSCYGYETNYAKGGRGEGDDAFFGVDTELGARASAHTRSGFNNVTTRHAHAWATAGWGGTYKGRTQSASFTFPWAYLGEISTQIQQTPGITSRAEADTVVTIGVRDLTAQSTLGEVEIANIHQQGQALKDYHKDGKNTIFFTVVNNHKYVGYIRVRTDAESDTPHPFLLADSLNDFFSQARRAWLAYAKITFNQYDTKCS